MESTTNKVPLVSIIIPAYNAATMVEETLDSLLRQTHPAIEIIVVDDGSKDDTAAVVRRYGRGVQLLQQNNSGGCSAPRNTGLRVAQGEFVTFFDADDLMRPTKIASQVANFQAAPQIVASLTDYRNFTASAPFAETHFETCPQLQAELARRGASPAIIPGDTARDLLLIENFNISNSPMYRADFLRAQGAFDENLKASEDYELIYRVAGFGPLGVLREVGFDRRMHDSNMTTRMGHVLTYKIASRAKLAALENDAARRKALERRVGDYHLHFADFLAESRDAGSLRHLAGAWRHGVAGVGRSARIVGKLLLGPRRQKRAG